MSDAKKRKLSGKQIVSDIRAGLDAQGLKRKYGLSDKAFESVCKQLSDAGALPKQEMRHLTYGLTRSEPPLHKKPSEHPWQCPACHAAQSSPMTECPDCGVVVAKFLGRQQAANDSQGAVYTPQPPDESPGANKWASVVVSIVVLALIGGTVVVWSLHRSNQKAKIAALDKLKSPPSEQFSHQTGSMEGTPDDQSSSSVDPATETAYPETTTIDPGKAQAEPRLQEVSPSPPPVPIRVGPEQPFIEPKQYVTGVFRQFTSNNFKKEAIEASKTFPVIFQFYSDT